MAGHASAQFAGNIKQGAILACSALLGGAGGRWQTPSTTTEQVRRVGWISASEAPLRFRRRGAEQAYGDQVWLLVPGGSQQSFKWLIAIATMTHSQKRPMPPAGRLAIQSLTSEANQPTSPAAEPPLRRKRSHRDVGIECGAGQPGLGHHDFQAPQFLFDRRQLTCAKDVWPGPGGSLRMVRGDRAAASVEQHAGAITGPQ